MAYCDFGLSPMRGILMKQKLFQVRGLRGLGSCFVLLAAMTSTSFGDEPVPVAEPQAIAPLFRDIALEAAVRAEVYEKRYNQDILTVDDVKNISRVVGRGKGVKNLAGLEHCAALMLIDLEGNEISDLAPISKLTKLQSVTLSGNKIADIAPLKDLVAMQLLDLSRNEVSDLGALAAMKNLRTLYVARNKLTTLAPLAELTKIWSLDASANQLTDLAPVSSLSWLTMLDIRQNQVKSLDPIASLRELDFLLISGNQIDDLTMLLAMCRKDAEGEKRFSPYLKLYLGENPLNDVSKGEQIEELKKLGVKVFLE